MVLVMAPLCEVDEDSNQSENEAASVRVVGGRWCHGNLPDLFLKVQIHHTSRRPALWMIVGVLTRTAWNIHNKLLLVIEHVSLIGLLILFIKCMDFCSYGSRLASGMLRDDIDQITAGRSYV